MMYEMMMKSVTLNASIEKEAPPNHYPAFSQELKDSAMDGLKKSIELKNPDKASSWVDLLVKMGAAFTCRQIHTITG